MKEFEGNNSLVLVTRVSAGKFKLIKSKQKNSLPQGPATSIIFGEILGEIQDNRLIFKIKMSKLKEVAIWINILVFSIVVLFGVFSERYEVFLIALFFLLGLLYAYLKTKTEVDHLENLLINKFEGFRKE